MVNVRPATADDCRLIWEWANESTVRAASFQSSPIPWERHQEWFNGKLSDPKCRCFIILDDDRAIGQMRFEIGGDEAEVHISVANHERGRGYATQALRVGCTMLDRDVRRVVGHIKPDNLASIRAFEKAGFVHEGHIVVAGQPAERMVLNGSS